MKQKTVALGLQGGGSHGAFTWGVLDRLLEDGRLRIDAISGASAGTMNAVVLAHGMTHDGHDGARAALDDFWNAIATKPAFSLDLGQPLTTENIGVHSDPAPVVKAALTMARFFSPQQLNPFDLNPLRDLLQRQVDFERLRTACPIDLYIASTHVASGRVRIFRTGEISLDVMLASACLPAIHRAIEIEGEAYWDGGFTANPPVLPLLYRDPARDILLVLLQGAPATGTPSTVDEIGARVADIGFSAGLSAELHALALAMAEARRTWFGFGRIERRLRKLNMHLLDAPELMARLAVPSKLNTDAAFLNGLKRQGREHAEQWLSRHFESVGVQSTFDLSPYRG